MALTLVENKVCGACGADVRPNSLFCYNCGGTIVEKSSSENLPVEKIVEEKVTDEKEAASPALTVKDENVAKDEAEKSVEPFVQEETNLKSAARLRRKPKSVQKKTIEVVWEDYESAPNFWFLGVAIVITILVATILFLAMYLK